MVRRYDPKTAILNLFVLLVLALAHPHKYQVGQDLLLFVRILDPTYAQTAVVRTIYQTCKYHESVRSILVHNFLVVLVLVIQPILTILSDREMTQDSKENRIRSRGTRNELQPNCMHNREDSERVSPENARKICTLINDGIPTLVINGIHWCCAFQAPLVVYIIMT